jgi:NTE family protein
VTPKRKTPTRRPRKESRPRPRVALVLGGGGLKGFAHIGVMRALAEHDIVPTVYAGTSIGALIASAAAGGMPVDEMADRARALKRSDLFRLNRLGMFLDRMHLPAIYLEGPLRQVCESVCPKGKFHELVATLLVNTVDLQRGTQVVWGLPGLKDVEIADAVYASCALPGFYPPGNVDGRPCVDGGVMDNLPVAIAGRGMDAVIAVDTGSSAILTEKDVATHGFSAIYMRAATTMMHALQLAPLEHWAGPPMTLIRPRVTHIGWFSFSHADELMDAGYRAAQEALEGFESTLGAGTGIFPLRSMRISVDRDKCIGCTLCAALAPQAMAMDEFGKAVPWTPEVEWSPADGDFVQHCPTYAIDVAPLEPAKMENPPEALEVPPAEKSAGAA